MKIIPIEEATPGMRLAKPILGIGDGRILLQENIELNSWYIEKIKLLKFTHICIKEPQQSNAVITPIIEVTRAKATVYLKGIIRELKGNDRVDVHKMINVVKEVIEQILSDSYLVYSLSKIRAFDNYTFSHSVNVGVISLLVGSVMGFDRYELEELGIGAMLHDIGKTTITDQILNKATKLEPEEYETVKKHTKYGYEILKTRANTTYLTAHVAFQHHEREDGSGYPRGLIGKEIHRFAKIVAVADVFDAMTTPRPYQKEVAAHIAINEISDHNLQKFDPWVVRNFTKVVAPYPLGSILLLNNGQNVAVTYIARDQCLVKVTQGPHQGKTYNLYQNPQLKVVTKIS